jgi:hypothetical protein
MARKPRPEAVDERSDAGASVDNASALSDQEADRADVPKLLHDDLPVIVTHAPGNFDVRTNLGVIRVRQTDRFASVTLHFSDHDEGMPISPCTCARCRLALN